MRYFFLIISTFLLLTACSKDDSSDTPQPNPVTTYRRTVVVYISGENNLSSYAQTDIGEMETGRQQVAADDCLVLFVDKASKTEKPFIARVTQDLSHPLDTLYRYEQDFYASDVNHMVDALDRCLQLCPATEDYGLVLWGHASGWIIENDSVADTSRRAYGVDNGNNDALLRTGKWLNIPSLRKVLELLPVKWKFIFCDCCNMGAAEVAYEWRNRTEYLIASPAEITGYGAPYHTVVPALFIRDDEQMYKSVCDNYYNQTDAAGGRLPISVVRMSKMEQLAQATRSVLPTVAANVPKDDFGQGHIYYFGVVKDYGWGVYSYLQDEKTLYDMNDIMRWALSDDAGAYQTWRSAFDQAVVYSRMSTYWHADCIEKRNSGTKAFKDFTVTDEAYGGLSMFFPQTKHDNSPYYRHNELIKQLSWYYAVGWSEAGW